MKFKLRPEPLPPDWPLRRPETLICTWFGVGLAPIASGTWGSLAALPLGWLAAWLGGWPALLALAAAVSLLGIWAGSRLVAGAEVRDPGFIVVDEVAGMLLTLVFTPLTVGGYALAFVLFRVADIVKPFPAGWCDTRLHGGLGVMLDDLVAGVYAGLGVMLGVFLVTEFADGLVAYLVG